MSILKEWILIIDLPKKIYEFQKKGLNHFEADFKEDTRRLEVKAWKRRLATTRNLACLGCTRKFNNPGALALHERVSGHRD